ncbi:MAG TPA: hypothetical protein VEY88_05115, partial [Archangium sp.]|nr:hypothetical protein [Archangium sp.]
SGALLWLSHFDTTSGVAIKEPVLDSSDHVFLTGYFTGKLTVDGTTLSKFNYEDSFAVKLDGASGDLLWLSQFKSIHQVVAREPVLDASGNLIVSGVFYKNLTLGQVILPNPNGLHTFVAKLDGTSGALLWHSHITTYTERAAISNVNGDVLLTGYFTGNITVGGIPFSTPSGSALFTMKLDGTSGTLRWLSRFYASTGYVQQHPLQLDASGNLILVGAFTDTLTLGGTTLSNSSSGNFAFDYFVGKLDGVSGALLWHSHLDGAGSMSLGYPSLDASGNATISGWFESSITLNGITLSSGNTYDFNNFVAKFQGSSGELFWAQKFGNIDWLAVASPESSFVAGTFRDSLDLGGPTPLTSAGCSDIFLAKLPATP